MAPDLTLSQADFLARLMGYSHPGRLTNGFAMRPDRFTGSPAGLTVERRGLGTQPQPLSSWNCFPNVNEMQSDDPELEKGIVEGVGSYGKQLGRIVDALKVVCTRLDLEKLIRDEREAVSVLSRPRTSL